MATEETPPRERAAIFVDGDNATAKMLAHVVEEVSKYGTPTIRRVYANFLSTEAKGWKQQLADLAFTPVQQFAVARGKNSTDVKLIIDAMDTLYNGDVSVFCIVSSDSDFMPLAIRLREAGKLVIGIGERQTPEPLQRACRVFVYTDNLGGGSQAPARGTRATPRTTKRPAVPKELLVKAFGLAQGEDGWAQLGTLGSQIQELDPGFDPRTYGHTRLLELVKASKMFDLDHDRSKGRRAMVYVKPKE